MKLALLLLLVGSAVGCRREQPAITSCGDSLAGTWRTEHGDWAVVDNGQAINAFPQFDDSHAAEVDPTLEVAPRLLHLERPPGDAPKIVGQIVRRYMQGSSVCEATAAVHVLACHGNTLELTLADPSVPLSFAPCSYSARMNPSRKETWQRVY
ncbi:MAG TPA: hypothetical protein VGM90_25360 [Kofleriaceae bacterium]|jgi:hypothetical protein